ncbi:MAG TPA: cytochrome c biogenesis protein CcsA [Bacteroidales bacterium]|nr:cytochrome c biogenesis protein CcsA [Bacteroidales bacterium]
MNAIKKVLFSFQTTLVYLLIFIVSIAIATFIENDHGSDTAKALVYNAWWFELLLILLCINFIGNVFIARLLRKEKLSTLVFHFAFILILVGAGITRYFGEEGMMHIRKGQTQSFLSTTDYYLKANLNAAGKEKNWYRKLLLSASSRNKMNERISVDGKTIDISIRRFLPDAIPSLVPSEKGKPTISLVLGGMSGREEHHLTAGNHIEKNGIAISFEDTSNTTGLFISRSGDSLLIRSRLPLDVTNMGNQGAQSKLDTGKIARLTFLTLYKTGALTMVVKQYLPKAGLEAMPNENINKELNTPDALVVDIESGGQKKTVTLWGGKGFDGEKENFDMNGVSVSLSFGSLWKEVPFSLKLDRFILERYPGSKSPAAFQSNITLIDNEEHIFRRDSIYMNNVLQYRGYRFYQSSYDEDEQGTYLSVNRDMPGTIISYLGYLLLAIGFAANLLNPKSRFRWLLRQSSAMKSASKAAAIIFLLTISSLNLNAAPDSLNIKVDEAKKFGELLVQDRKGRVEPMSTLASEIIRKITRSSNFNGLTSEQVFLGMNVYPEKWKNVPMIKISHPGLKDFFRTDKDHIAFYDCFDSDGNYRLADIISEAYKKKPATRNKFDTELIRTDERVNIAYMVYTGQYLNIFPKQGDPNHTWYSPLEVPQHFTGMDSLFASNILTLYFESVAHLPEQKAQKDAVTFLESMHKFQQKYGQELLPSPTFTKMETLYNRADVFNRLMKYYSLFGGLLLLLQFISLFIKKYKPLFIEKILVVLLIGSFVFHTAGLIVRWYLSGHAPWSNGFESLTYIAWATVLAGILFVRKSKIALSATTLLASVILSVAHLSWMDPEITNVVPVLNSYWLSIHVSVISASYGFFALGALLGFLNLLLMFFRNEKNRVSLGNTITQLSYIIEMTLILGLFLVSIGTFLGGVWANESWGRYWGWDPKETWALVTLLVYAFVAHMRFVPALKNPFVFNFAALISFSSVIMTYFGVNFYLSGLHSYGKGDPVPIPVWIYYTLFVIFVVALMAFFNERKMNKLSPDNTNI